MSDPVEKFNAAWPGVKRFHDRIAEQLGSKVGWGVDIQVGDVVECAALPTKNHGYFIVVEVREELNVMGRPSPHMVRVVHAISKRPVANNGLESAYHFRKVDPVQALGSLNGIPRKENSDGR